LAHIVVFILVVRGYLVHRLARTLRLPHDVVVVKLLTCQLCLPGILLSQLMVEVDINCVFFSVFFFLSLLIFPFPLRDISVKQLNDLVLALLELLLANNGLLRFLPELLASGKTLVVLLTSCRLINVFEELKVLLVGHVLAIFLGLISKDR
jgi:hypothetical protein